MNKIVFLFIALFSSLFVVAQVKQKSDNEIPKATTESPKAKHTQYEIYTVDNDTTYVDTSLTIQSDYKFNYLRKDTFGLLPYTNEGQTYAKLDFSSTMINPYPEFGFKAKHFGYLNTNDIKYYSVATPLTELYFKSVMEQGQNVDAIIAVNTSKQFNFSIAYKGLRSLGKYINQLSSTGNLRFTSSYFTKNKRYVANFHFTGQDILNGENGGITTIDDFESENQDFDNRARFQVYFTDAKTFLKGKRVFIDHSFRINPKDVQNSIHINHQFNYESKFFEYNQNTLATTIGDAEAFQRFGESDVTSNINNQVRNKTTYNKLGATYENKTLGKLQFFVEDYFYNYYYGTEITVNTIIIPSSISKRVNAIGGQYLYQKKNWNAKLLYNKAISTQTFSQIEASINYKLNDKNNFAFQYENVSKIPDNNFQLHQSSYKSYNWSNNFKNEKINNIKINANTQWLNASAQFTLLNDYLYFSNDNTAQLQLISPKQYTKTINYIAIKASKELKYKKFALDNTVLYQNVSQDEKILNVPQIVTRNTLYFTDYMFKKALLLQTGVTFSYFTKHYINDYNPVLAESFVQNTKQVGDFPVFDIFVNARVRQTRLFLKAEHFNSGFSGNKFYTAPNYPYRDFMIRFGLVWNFFQ